jgi:hypothetical protein
MDYALGFVILYVIVAVIFMVATIVYSFLIGPLDFGALWPFLAKAALLIGIVAAVLLLPYGGWLALPIWWVGVMLIFGVDFWQARILVAIVWVLTFLVRLGFAWSLYHGTWRS